METALPAPIGAPPRVWPLFLAGALLFILGPVIYTVRFRMQLLDIPWYAPILATIGVFVMAAAVWRRPGIFAGIVLVLFIAMCGFEWFMLLVGTKAPPYAGPAQPGLKVPPFATTLADGTTFTNKDLENGSPTILLFFRGRW